MKVVVAAALYPPDTTETAQYVKEVATRLSKSHEVVLVVYAYMPESIPNVRIVTINKRAPLLIRLLSFTYALFIETRDADVVYVENGPAVELPAGLVTRTLPVPLVVHLGDVRAYERLDKPWIYKVTERFLLSKAKKLVRDIPPTKPEILPFAPLPTEEHEYYEAAWKKHVDMLSSLFTHV